MRFTYTNVDITKLLEYIHTSNSNIMHEKQIEFVNTTNEQIFATTDGSRLDQVLTNFVRNAVDFTPSKGGKIEIGAKLIDEKIRCYVKDNGIGMPKKTQDNLFKKFYQADSSLTRKHGGTGLGLSICKGIIDALGGKIWVESEENKGSIFYFEVPRVSKEADVKK